MSDSEASFIIESGVLQGCPLSGSLFVIALQPFLAFVASRLRHDELICACADDLLTVVRCAASLKLLDRAFRYLEKVSGLTLNSSKLQFIPLTRTCNLHTIEIFRDWLVRCAPAFALGQIGYTLVYLGFDMGPRALAYKWKKQMESWKQRSNEIISYSVAASATIRAYNFLAALVRSYVSQL